MKNRSWLWFAAFAVAYLALRVFWITCDTGVPSTWEFGFHTTDEGYYLCGGKEMYLWGSFVDLTRQEALNYCYSYGTHWLSYLAHLCFGLSTWAWRIPFVALYFAAWMMMFGYIRRHAGAWFAFVTCLAASSAPLVVTYERGASNDATIAALAALGFALADGKGRWRIVAAAFATSLIATVKPAVWVMIPIVLSSLLGERKTRSRWLDAALFVALSAALAYAWKGVSALTVLGVARESGLTAWQVLAKVNATYGLPSIMDLAQDFRALASFPRDPSVKVMGATIVLISVVPAAMFLVNVLRRKWNGHLLLYLTVPLYALALNVINSMYTHYFLPLVILLPAVFSAIREDFDDLRGDAVAWRRLSLSLALIAAAAVAVLFAASAGFSVQEAAPLYSRIHNLPQFNPWRMTWPTLAAGTLAGVAVVGFCRGIKATARESWLWAVVFFLVASVAFAALPAAVLAPRIRATSAEYLLPLGLNLAVGGMFSFVLFARPAAFARPAFAAAALAVPIVASYLVLPTWRSAAAELVTRRAHYDAELAAELAKIVPEDAVVLGERTDQAFFSLPIRTVSTFLSGSNPIPYVERLWQRDPKAKLFALIDSQCNYNLQHFQKHAKDYRLDLVKKFRMPSFSDGRLADVYLCRIIDLRKGTPK